MPWAPALKAGSLLALSVAAVEALKASGPQLRPAVDLGLQGRG